MTTLVHICAHCRSQNVAFDIVAQSYAPSETRGVPLNYLHLQCKACGGPSSARMVSTPPGQLGSVGSFPVSIQRMGWTIAQFWPEPEPPRVPAFLPDAVERAFLSAEKNFAQQDMEEASAASYGRALDVGTKLFAKDLAGVTLYSRIVKLAETNRVTADLAAWAHAIRLIRNDALHEIDSITRDELVAIRGFSEMVLTYLFSLPGMLKARQDLTAEKPTG